MAIREILREDDPVLRKVCHKVEKFDRRLWSLLDDMAETMYEANGVGLAAPQVGICRRVVVIDVGNGRIELINPEIIRTCGRIEGPEGCLSSPGEYGIVPRPEKARVRAQNRDGEWFEMSGEGLLARAFCHELDHLDGKLFKDLALRMMDPEELE
ncbi:peptide deformylase [Merdimmobilis hominis]|jgi:peptide deformylase|uniref:Peptide deformylase n=1 Tax=uncultured Anaerotruncus sp. TaxID=905011 RepID=A0A6N2V6P7_9FIRM|nr:peptide deformylase [Merdimmobilis hominis]MCD4837091.1 peptide deformylase [Merdimmobilis hominis]PWL58332.1 MAG: peptide deformylase [Oscillospiraceae bacterium]